MHTITAPLRKHASHCMQTVKHLVLLLLFSLCAFSCDDKEKIPAIDTDLTEEEMTEFYTDFETFIASPDFQALNTVDEFKSAILDWIKKLTEVKEVKTDGYTISITFTNGKKSTIELTEQIDIGEIGPIEDGQGYVDSDYFNGSVNSSVSLQKTVAVKQRSYVATRNSNESKHVYPVFWEPYAIIDTGLSDDHFAFNLMLHCKHEKENTLAPKECYKAVKGVADPLQLRTLLETPSPKKRLIPNVIVIATHGNKGMIDISVCKTVDDQKIIKKKLSEKGININDWVRVLKRDKDGKPIEVLYPVKITSEDLKKLLQGIDLSNRIVFVNACYSASDSLGGNKSVQSAFVDIGAAYVFGYTDTISNFYWNGVRLPGLITDELLRHFLLHRSIYGNHFPTAKEVFEHAKENTLLSEKRKLLAGSGNDNFKFASIVETRPPQRINNTTRSLAMTRNSSVPNAAAPQGDDRAILSGHINVYCPEPGAASYYGFVYSKDTDNPKLDDGKSKNEYIALDHEITDGEDYFLGVDDMEYNTAYYYRAFVATRAGEQGYAIYYADNVEKVVAEKEEVAGQVISMTTQPVNSVRLSMSMTGTATIDWGDGTVENYASFYSVIHSYSNPASYTITITGKDITYLNCGGDEIISWDNRIRSLDVSNCTTLTGLACGYNQLTSLDVSKNTALSMLDCSGNQLISLDVSKNTALTTLQCRENQLLLLDVRNCTALTRLLCSGNQLSALNVSNCNALTVLECNNNQLANLNVNGCSALTDLYCGNNQLTGLDMSSCTALVQLYCDGNQLTSLNMNGSTALRRLSCSRNQITTPGLGISGCRMLEYLYCENNQLTGLNMTGYTVLKRLSCDDNRLTGLDVTGSTALTDLSCTANQLTAAALNSLFGTLNNTATEVAKLISIYGNPGIRDSQDIYNPDIARAKGWRVKDSEGGLYN